MEIGRDDVDGLPNRWPDQLDDEGKNFKRIMQSFFARCKDLHTTVMQSIAVGMGLPEHFFDEFTNDGDNIFRLLHYPPVSKEVFLKNLDSSVRASIATMAPSRSFSRIHAEDYRCRVPRELSSMPPQSPTRSL